MEQRVIISTKLESELVSALSECEHDKLFCAYRYYDIGTMHACIAEFLLHEGSPYHHYSGYRQP